MEIPPTVYTYRETRLDLDSSIQDSTVAIRLPAPGASWSSRTAQRRPHLVELPVAENEEIFKQRHIATAASIYHRVHHKSPRSFLWRILEDGKVLSIRAVDVSRQPHVADANLTLRLSFPSRIIPTCVALSDSDAHDVLSVFVMTESKYLYTLNLRPDHFRKPSSTEDNVGDWCKSYSQSSLTFKVCHRLVALAADVLLLSFTNGELIRLTKKSGGDGSEWEDRHFNEGGWGNNLRSFMPASLQSSTSTHPSTATAMASVTLNDMLYCFTVTLDHRLRIWNFIKSKIVYMEDLLGEELEGPENAKRIDPENSQLIRVYSENEDTALCVTYSPLGAGQFKFWRVSPEGDGNLRLIDLFPDNVLEPQRNTPVNWTLADFALVLDKADINNFTLWILWKNNTASRVQKLLFESGPESQVRNAWREGWVDMAPENLESDPVKMPAHSGDPSDVVDQWLQFILSPGRFTRATIETGLAICEQSPGHQTIRKNATLPERMCSAIASTASLNRTSDGRMDYKHFRNTTNAHWESFYNFLQLLDKQRAEALSMVIDSQGDMPLVVSADGIVAVRECSGLERIWYNNKDAVIRGDDEFIARPIFAASAFRKQFSTQVQLSCKGMLLEEIFEEPSLTDLARMRMFYDKCDFANEVGDYQYDELVKNLGGDFKEFTLDVCNDILQLTAPAADMEKRPLELPLAEFGNKLILKGVQKTVELHQKVCFDFLVLLVFIEAEINNGEEGTQFETAAVFRQLVFTLKRLELIDWLVSTQISLPVPKTGRSNSTPEKASKKQTPKTKTITILEGLLHHLFSLDLKEGEVMAKAVTEVLLTICDPESEIELHPALIQCFLLKHDRHDLAMEFSKFAGQDAFSNYIQGRVHLANNDSETAAMFFKKAAFAYQNLKHGTDTRSAGYLDEIEKNSLNAGLPKYYAHIVSLYDQQNIFSFVIDFARLSLQFIPPGNEDITLRSDMYNRLFTSAIQTARFDIAYATLSLFTDHAVQHSSLRKLVIKMCETSYASQLIDLPFISLQDSVDEILAQKCQSIVDVNVGIPYHKILYAWRIKRGDFRGAASVSLERLQRLQQSGDGDRGDGLETPVTRQYISLINALSCVDPKQAWILSEELPVKPGQSKNGEAQAKRKVVTLEEVRTEYQGELDRIAAIDNNQFAFNGGDEMDVL
ncbi:Nucleoporin [Lachnellula cervina]|uniref:Nucleoporin n=1 Tax=Lachnellula cervina TaxID=1316786 RepID=A0A7D8URJ9_9HELO|nr:Nucleoporin [Lachnellula cervina]